LIGRRESAVREVTPPYPGPSTNEKIATTKGKITSMVWKPEF